MEKQIETVVAALLETLGETRGFIRSYKNEDLVTLDGDFELKPLAVAVINALEKASDFRA